MSAPWPYPTTSLGSGMEGLAYPQVTLPPGRFSQYPSDLADFEIDWADFLATNDTIASSLWTADDGITLGNSAFTARTSTIWVTGGLPGYRYRVSNTISTVGGRHSTRVLTFAIKHPPLATGETALGARPAGAGALRVTATPV